MSKILQQLASLSAETAAAEAVLDGPQVLAPAAPASERLAALTARLHALKPNAAQHVAELGRLLKEVKALLGHGTFVAWLAESVQMTRSTATKYMHAAELKNIAVLESLGVEKLYILRTMPNVDELTPDTTLPVPPQQTEKSLRDMSTRDLRAAVQAIAPGRPTRRALRRDLVQRYVHLRDELNRVVQQLHTGDEKTRTRFERSTGQQLSHALDIARQLP